MKKNASKKTMKTNDFTLKDKKELLKKDFLKYKKVLIAYSGGVDSTLLIKTASDALGKKNVIAATATSLTYTKSELKTAKELTKNIGIKHIIFKTDEFDDSNFINNSEKRCYYCKKELFSKMKELKKKYKCEVIMDGSNYDDISDFRPGSIAEKEANICTPLKNAYFTKNEIREFSKELGLKTYDFPSLACLSSRIAYNEKITGKKIEMIAKAEEFLKSFGFKNLRVRTSNLTARIEVDKENMGLILIKKDQIIKKLKSLGYVYITLDLDGFRSGSMNEVLKKSKKSGY